MASKIQWRMWFIVLFVNTMICCCIADDYFLYGSDEFPYQQNEPVFKLLSKRQAPDMKETFKEKKVIDQENSSSSKAPMASGKLLVLDPQTENQTNIMTSTPTVAAPFNETFPVEFNGENITVTNVTQDYHKYYNSSTYTDGMQFWIDYDNDTASTHEMLSQSHRRAATVTLSFEFPFYGHLIRNITIATGGFLYTGEYVHSWLAATQYIAPLMANFDTSMSNTSTIKYMDNGTAFSVQWDQVSLQDKPNDGTFSFQATLLKSGDIIFAYKEIPISVTSIIDESHPVKVGVSDAYIIDRTIFFVRRKTIYEYHKVDKKTDDVATGSAIYFTALPTCIGNNTCETCISNTIGFECVWCSSAQRCSDGMDRYRQDWLVKGCDKSFIDTASNCNLPIVAPTTEPLTEPSFSTSAPSKFPSTTTEPVTRPWDDFDPSAIRVQNDTTDDAKASNVSSVVGILFLVAILVGMGGWLFYAYRNPHTPSGQCFIRYRPSQWRWRSGEAHYTAAAIHM